MLKIKSVFLGIYILVDTYRYRPSFCFELPMRTRILPTQTKEILELTIIDIKIDTNCRKNKITVNSYIVPLF